MIRPKGTYEWARIHRGGFALMLVIGLLTILIVLLLALAALAQIEARDARATVAETQARRNALMALQLGLGCLQKYAGPDTRVTATAQSFGEGFGTSHYTGVWDATAPGVTPLTWLVSGNEGTNSLARSPSDIGETVELVGLHTAGAAGDVLAPKQPLSSDGVADGHYAWWVGDEGVKAAVVDAASVGDINYPPFDFAEGRERIRQQVPLGAGPAGTAGQPVVEPRDGANATVLSRIFTLGQIAYLNRVGSATPVGADPIRVAYHDWSPGNEAVLATTNPGGLRRDLSLRPDLLGPAFAAWANYPAYMEDPASPVGPAISPVYPSGDPRNALRRRYRLTAPLVANGIQHGVAPVLSYFLITFNVRTDPSASGSLRPLVARARWLVSLWNPYTSAMVPEPLQLEISGLPNVNVINDTLGVSVASLSLDSLYGAPLRISLPWVPAGRDDQQSWLSGRVYTWAAQEDLNKGSPPPAGGFASVFYTRNLSTAAGQGVQRAVPSASVANSAQLHLNGAASQLTVRLYRTLSGGGQELLRSFISPGFPAFATTPTAAGAATYQFTCVFHLTESADTPAAPETWLTTAGQDPREAILPAGAFSPAANGPRPELYPNYTAISFPDRLLDRALPAALSSATGQSYNEDTPLFELPRGPLLSLGGLQQLPLSGARPFASGNSWGAAGGSNAWFDRYFFSGLATGVSPPSSPAFPALPNPLLRIEGSKPDGPIPDASDLLDPILDGYSSKYLLQRGAFNLNSTSSPAWLAILRAGRWTTGDDFNFLAALAATGTSGDVVASVAAQGDAVFYRFPFSAQETYLTDVGYAASTTVPPAMPNVSSAANTHLFRRGVRVFSAEQTVALSNAIAALLQTKLADSGPYRSLEEFLGPSPLFGGMSLLERALADAVTADGLHLNDPAAVPEFSSQWLTQGDLLGVLAPVLFSRSDTFVIRAYGDAAPLGPRQQVRRAWCEARVQRLPNYVDATQPAETSPDQLNATNQALGRRFKVVTFRWLTSADI